MPETKMIRELDDFLAKSPFAWWEWSLPENTVVANAKKVEMLGYSQSDFEGKGYEAFTELLHPEDYERTMKAMIDHLDGSAPLYQVDYRIKASNGEYRWYMDRGGIIERNSAGAPLRVRGIVIDLGDHIYPGEPLEVILAKLRKAVPSDRTKRNYMTVCTNCLRVKAEDRWFFISDDLSNFISLEKTHGICPDCLRLLYPEYADEIIEKTVSLTP